MGFWGVGPFENDAAADFLDLLNDTPEGETTAAIEQVLDSAVTTPHLSDDDAATALAAAAVVAYGTGAHGSGTLDDLVTTKVVVTPALAGLAIDALDRVVAPGSELAGLWAEGGMLAQFTHNIETLQAMLHTEIPSATA